MKYRYGYNSDGNLVRVAKVYSKQEHHISSNEILRPARSIIKRLTDHGFQAFVVGGAVRDLLLKMHPKDFDVVTNAHPFQIKTLFRRSRVIGRRFRIVHVLIGNHSVIEVSTFRKNVIGKNLRPNAAFGTMEEDVLRRDFTCNALYYDPKKEELIDFVNALSHMQKGRLVPILMHFEEDPVRMLRAIKFSVKCNLRPSTGVMGSVKKNAPLIGMVDRSRMTEEISKILSCGHSSHIFRLCYKTGLLTHMMPAVFEWITEEKRAPLLSLSQKNARLTSFLASLTKNDERDPSQRSAAKNLAAFLDPFVKEYVSRKKASKSSPSHKKVVTTAKSWIAPITPPNDTIREALALLGYRSSFRSRRRNRNQKSAFSSRSSSRIRSTPKSARSSRHISAHVVV